MKPEDLEALRDDLLVRQLELLSRDSPYYRQLFAREKVDVSRIRGIRDLPVLPVTFREDYLRGHPKSRALLQHRLRHDGHIPADAPHGGDRLDHSR